MYSIDVSIQQRLAVTTKHVFTRSEIFSALGSHGHLTKRHRKTYKTIANCEKLMDLTSSGIAWDTWRNVRLILYHANGAYTGRDTLMRYGGKLLVDNDSLLSICCYQNNASNQQISVGNFAKICQKFLVIASAISNLVLVGWFLLLFLQQF